VLLDLIDKERKNKGRTKEGTIDFFSLGIPDGYSCIEIDSSRSMDISVGITCPVVSVS
jgi:hypothetical protein